MPIVRRPLLLTPEEIEYQHQVRSKIKIAAVRASVLAMEPDKISRFRCLCCGYIRASMRTHKLVCTDCDGNGIMTRLQYLSFGRSTPFTDFQQRAIHSAQRMGIVIEDRFQSEYDASEKARKARSLVGT